ncbi:hypothetical protein DL93DRAFT_719988 [Clavulina sp. PMI_390]|nr:hypothetical protein DL93DRAFT_719988 [Clavulina sp. PMI_390]
MPVLTANPPSHPFRCVLHGIDPTSEAVNTNKIPTPGDFQQIYNLYWNDPVKGEFSSASAHDYFIGVLSAYGQMEDTIRSNAELNWERVQASLPDRYGHRPALASIHRAQSLYSTWVQPLVVAWIDEVEVQKRLWAKETHDLDASFSDLYTPENSRYKWRDITKIDISNIQQLLLFLHDRQRQELELELRRSTNPTAQDFVTQIATTPMLRKCARNLPPNAAQCLMLMVQQTLDSQGKSAQTKIDHTLVKLLQDIAYTTRSFPYFARVNVFNVSRGPVRGGTEGALFVARLDGNEVMVKVHRDHYAGILSKPLIFLDGNWRISCLWKGSRSSRKMITTS